MKLISMTEFCLNLLNENPPYDEVKMLKKISNYANFLKQPLTLGMFIPCDEEGNVLNGKPLSPASDEEWDRWEKEQSIFKQAKERVLFEGFEFAGSYLRLDGIDFVSVESLNSFDIDDLTYWSKDEFLELTDSAIKQLGV